VLSKDTGYDPAITHARTLAFDLLRIENLGTANTETQQPEKAPKKEAPKKTTAPKATVATQKAAAAKKAAPAKKTPPAAKKVVAKKTAAPVKTPSPAPASNAAPAKAARSNNRTLGAIYRDVLQGLRMQVPNRPKSREALERHVQTQFGPEPAPDKVRAIVDRLFTVEAVRQEGVRLVYFPNGSGDASAARSSEPATQPAAS
jgi:hypothetical protein